ncbi:MAG: flippase-like domain-containing protein [Deltaproteobacteria bacterium]|nr:flippase-like domain-containing protein [Deltaproteobacteria bacterium]
MTEEAKPKSRGSLMAWVGGALSLVAVGILVWRVDFKDVKTALASAELVWLVPAVAIFVALFLVRSWRWSLMLGHSPYWATFHANNIGYMLNVTLPLRMGELARVFVVSRIGKVGVAHAFSIAIVERLLDLGAVVVLFAIFAQFIPMGPSFNRAATVGLVVVLASVAAGILVVVKGDAVERIARPWLARLGEARADAVMKRFHEVVQGFRSLGSLRAVLMTSVLTVAIWGMTIIFTALCMRAFLAAHTAVGPAGLVVVVANLGGAVPSAPGGLGIVQGFATSALVVPFKIPESEALAFVLVWSLGSQVMCVVLGLLSMTRVGLSFSEIRRGATGSSGG